MSFYKLIFVVNMRFLKQMTLNAEVSFDIFCKVLGLFRVSFGSLVTYFEHRIAAGAFRFEEICYLMPLFLDLILS